MLYCKETEVIEEETSDDYDYLNEEPLEDEESDKYEEQEDTYCD
jgi:hypothetical protein